MTILTPETIDATHEDWWVCPCGNEPGWAGFFPCDDRGEWAPVGSVTGFLRCAECGRVGNADALDPATGTVPVVTRTTDRTDPPQG